MIRRCFEAVTTHPARILHMDSYGIAPGCHVDFVLLHAKAAAEAIPPRATRLKVYRRGKLLSQTAAPLAEFRPKPKLNAGRGLHDSGDQ